MEVLAHSLKIKDTHGAVLFSADKNEVMIGANSLRIDGDGGAVFRESVQTSVIRAEPGRELKYDSKIRFGNRWKSLFLFILFADSIRRHDRFMLVQDRIFSSNREREA